MALIKYRVTYYDIVGIEHVVDIYDPNYSGQIIEVSGTVMLDYVNAKDTLEIIRGKAIRVSLDADVSLTYEDLFSEDEQTFNVTYRRDGTLLFNGWLNSEGWYEDWVADKWLVSFDCIDGFGYLKDFAFVDSGVQIISKMTMLEALQISLARTGLNQDICIAIDIFYTGANENQCTLAQAKVNTQRYIKDDQETIMSCEEVINDILEPFGAVIASFNNTWWVYKPNQIYKNSMQTFKRYSFTGTLLSDISYNFEQLLGSQINGFYPHHCSENQNVSNNSSIGALRIVYKYGIVESFLDNPNFLSDGTGYEGWTINDPTYVTVAPSGENGVKIEGGNGVIPTLSLTSDAVGIEGGSVIALAFRTDLIRISGGIPNRLFQGRLTFQMKLTTTSDVYYYNQSLSLWELNASTNKVTIDIYSYFNNIATIKFAPTELIGDLEVIIWTPGVATLFPTLRFYMNLFEIVATVEVGGDVRATGLVYDFYRATKPSAKVEEREVFTGDSPVEIYTGTIYKEDGNTPTETWYRKGVAEQKNLLSIMGEEVMRMNQKTIKIFSGDIYGYIPYMSSVTIHGILGLFMFTKYSYDTQQNVTSMELRQIFGDEFTPGELITPEPFQEISGKVIKPTIVS